MPSVLPFDIIEQIIDIVGEREHRYLLKRLALISHSFLQVCSKHLFATIDLHGAFPMHHIASSKKGFVKLVKSRPGVVKYIRTLKYHVGDFGPPSDDDHLLSPILPNFLRTISYLNCLTISTSDEFDWNVLDSSLKSSFLHLMHLPTINYINLSDIRNFSLSNLTPSVNLRRLDISSLRHCNSFEEDGSPEIVVQSKMAEIHEFHTSQSSLLTSKLLHAKRQDGQPAFNVMDLRRLSIYSRWSEDEQNIRYLLQNAELLEKLHLLIDDGSVVGLLSPRSCTLKVLDLSVPLYGSARLPLAGLCEELEAMAGHNIMEVLSIEVQVDANESGDLIGSIIQKLEKVLVNPGWSVLRQVSFRVFVACFHKSSGNRAGLSKVLELLPDKYLSYLPKLESVAFNYSIYDNKCQCYFFTKHKF